MNNVVQVISKTRKERILEGKRRMAKARNSKVAGYVLAGTVATSALFNLGAEKASAECNNHKYIVQKGDTLYKLANKYDVTVEQLKSVNELQSEFIIAGQSLKVPGTSIYKVKPGDTLSYIARQYNVTVKQIKNVNQLSSDVIKVGQSILVPTIGGTASSTSQKGNLAEEKSSPDIAVRGIIEERITQTRYKVEPGDTLWGIGRQFQMSIDEIKALNKMTSDLVIIGQELVIKQKDLYKTKATVVGAVDSFSVEFVIGGEFTVMQVPFGTASRYEELTGAEIEIVFLKSTRPTLVNFVFSS
ncbi:LysM peptidoglycan-binding domain-containing protein [Bacillus sp. FJAT-45350]|uniref:LysM peptidoglycan-binding domain-containing protein n=1 Tax=Bacillus sp. FJAT-45350 TaxID=2011014 RepID=UPI000BB6CCC7|nr:LysM peptidoglycan-binding domain-containing protein [Bacillus sp. FJAT-45350]